MIRKLWYIYTMEYYSVIKRNAVNTGVHVSLSFLVSSVCMLSSRTATSHGSFISSFLRNLHTALHSDYTSLHSHQQCRGLPFLHTFPSVVSKLFNGSDSDCHEMILEWTPISSSGERHFDDDHSDWSEMILYCGFDLHFPN